MGTIGKKLARFSTRPARIILGDKAQARLDPFGKAIGAYEKSAAAPEETETPAVIDPGAAYSQRDRIRRRASRAQGQASTIRTGGPGAPYTGAPSKLLGG